LDRKVAKGANLLVKQFEMKKAADTHKRTMISKTGILDTVKMVNYKFSDDIFRRNATITEGKNHGVVCFIDWSGSMSSDMSATIEQLYLLATFCKKANIPFDFYAFSNITPWEPKINIDYQTGKESTSQAIPCPIKPLDASEERLVQPPSSMCLYHLVSGEMKNREFTECMTNLALIHTYWNEQHHRWRQVCLPRQLGLGGTPLDDCIVLARDIVRQFRQKHRLQIVHGVFLTDGHSHAGCTNYGTHLRDDRKNYELGRRYDTATAKLMDWFRDTTGAGAIGIFLTSTSRCACHQAQVSYLDESAAKKQFKKEKFISGGAIHGYTEYFVLKSDTEVSTGDFDEVSSDVSTTKLRSAFMKSQTQSITSRTVLNRIAELIAE
jgi:hypothetical protein